MGKHILAIIVLFIFWIINNSILKEILEKYQDMNDFTFSILNYRKTIMFDIIVLIFFIIFNVNFLIWIAIAYYVIIGILEGILLVISFFTSLDADIKNKNIDTDLWSIFIAKLLNEISTIIMIFILIPMIN